MLKCRNIIIDTEYFLEKKFDFDHLEFKALNELVKQGLATVYMTDITEREVRKKIKDEVKSAVAKLKVSELRYLSNVPLFQQFMRTYSLEALIALFEKRFRSFISKFKVKIITSEAVNILSVFDDYCETRPPFNDKKDKKAEFPDAMALAAIANWAKVENERAYLLSKDNDWEIFAQNSFVLWDEERYFDCIGELSQFTDLILRTEKSLKNIIQFADTLLEKRDKDIVKSILEKVRNTGFSGYSNFVDVYLCDAYILKAAIIFKQALSCDRDGATFSIDLECTGVFGYDVTDGSYAAWDRDDKIYRGVSEFTAFQKQVFEITVDVEIDYKDGLENNFTIKSVNVPEDIEIDYDDEAAESVNLKEWNLTIPVEVCGVVDGKISENGHGQMDFANFEEAKSVFPTLDIHRPSSEFSAAFGAIGFSNSLRFETTILTNRLSE